MKPRFGALTQVLAGVFLVAGIGAGWASIHTGSQTVGGGSADRAILFGIAVVCLVIGVGTWSEYRWCWVAGALLTLAVSVLAPVLGTPDQGWFFWWFVLVGFGASAVQGLRDRRPKPR